MRPLLRLALAGGLAVALGYQYDRSLTVPLGKGFLDARTTRGLYGPEADFRWTGEVGAVVVPEPGPGRSARVEVDLQAWRPRGSAPPKVFLEAGAARALAEATTEPQTVVLETTTSGWWSSDLEVSIRSEVFTPGGGDQRPLGVRVHEVRLVPLRPGWGLRGVPLRPLFLTALLLPLLHLLLGGARGPSRPSRVRDGFAWGAPALTLVAFALARAHAAAAVGLALGAVVVVLGVRRFLPGPCRAVARAAVETGCALRSGLRRLRSWAALPVALVLTLAVAGAYATRPRLVIDPTSRAAAAVLRNFGPPAGDDALRFRLLQRGSVVDLRDFGSGASWRVRASLLAERATRQPLPWLRLGPLEATSGATGAWTPVELAAPSPGGLRSGLVVEFPAAQAASLRLHRLELDRGVSLPSPLALLCVLGAAFLLAGAVAAAGAGPVVVWTTALSTGGLLAVAVRLEPLATVPFLPTALVIAAAAALVSAFATALARLAGAQGHTLVPPPGALATAALAFAAFWATTAYPLYRGGHFVFHSSIAEEIWRGRFLLFYLPYPGSILSRQAQWGDVVMPHPCLYHTLASPLAALPHDLFYFLEKGALALLLAGNVVLASLLALRAAGEHGSPGAERSSRLAAVLAAAIPSSYQLLGLGHLMTILGVFTFALAFSYVALCFDALPQRRTLVSASTLLTLCFLAYFAGLLFALVVLAVVAVRLRQSHPRSVRGMLVAATIAAAAAFVLYYIHWSWPFFSQTVPRLLAGREGGGDGQAAAFSLFRHLVRALEKLDYTFGWRVIPIFGLLGLGLVREGATRTLLLAWGGILVLFSGLDLFFNFLLKHHYFTIVPVAVGGGLLLAALAEGGRRGRLLSGAAVVAVVLLGAQRAFEAATGRIP